VRYGFLQLGFLGKSDGRKKKLGEVEGRGTRVEGGEVLGSLRGSQLRLRAGNAVAEVTAGI